MPEVSNGSHGGGGTFTEEVIHHHHRGYQSENEETGEKPFGSKTSRLLLFALFVDQTRRRHAIFVERSKCEMGLISSLLTVAIGLRTSPIVNQSFAILLRFDII